MREAQRAIRKEEFLDGTTRKRLTREAAESFRGQIEFGVPTTSAELALRQPARQLRAKKVRIKLFLRYPINAKLYLVHRTDQGGNENNACKGTETRTNERLKSRRVPVECIIQRRFVMLWRSPWIGSSG